MFGRPLRWTVAASIVLLVTSLLMFADVHASSGCRLIEPIADQINLFDSATAKVPVRQIEKGRLRKQICSFEQQNDRYRIQLQLSAAWVEAAQFHKVVVPAPRAEPQPPQVRLAPAKIIDKNIKPLPKLVGRPGGPATVGTDAPSEPPPIQHGPFGDVIPTYHPSTISAPRNVPPTYHPLPPSSPDTNQYVSVLYATNRVIGHNDPSPIPLTSITYKRDQTLRFGSALVRVPEAHNIGEVERPTEITIFGFAVYKASEDEKKHFTLKEIKRLDRDETVHYLAANSDHSAMVFVHGFNTPFQDAIFKTAQIAFDTHFRGVPIAFAWPSEGILSITGYNYDHESASYSWDALLQLFHLIRDDAGITNIYVIAHSMGNEILLDAMAHAHDAGDGIKLSEIIMASPDVARDVFTKRIGELKLLSGGLTLYASSADKALMVSHTYSDSVRAGDIPAQEGPVIAPGLDTIDITALGDDPFAFNHKVAGNRSVIDDIGRLISSANLTKRLTPGERSPQLIGMPALPPPTYWRYPN